VAAVCDLVRGRRRARKRLWLSFDEWNISYRTPNEGGHRQEAPHLAEEIYNLEDALLIGGVVNSLLRQAGRVRLGCLAQLVNVLGPLLTNDRQVLRQTIYYPYAWALKYARGEVLDLLVESATYEVPILGPVPYLDVAGTRDPETSDSFERPQRVVPQLLEPPRVGARMVFKLPPRSYTVVHLRDGER
jgi:alpha-N-arabinofuranosidase